MKRIIVLIIAAVLPLLASGQAQITTKKVKIEDFTEKITKVVTSGNIFFDQAMKNEIQERWRISPYEFCSLKEFEKLKTDDSYYFIIFVQTQFKKENTPSLGMISVVKGGPEAEEGIGKMLDVVTMPILSLRNPSGRGFTFLPAIVDIIQEHIIASMDNDITAYTGLANNTINISGADRKSIYIAEEDLSEEVTAETKARYTRNGVEFVPADEADSLFSSRTPDALVSFSVCPGNDEKGSYCYKMLIDAETYKLYYYRKHRITARTGAGFLIEDINRIATR